MRKKHSIDALFPRTRKSLLVAMVMHAEKEWSLSELARFIGVSPSSLQRELESLVTAEILVRKKIDKRVLYGTNENCPFLPELRGLIVKTAGIVDVLRDATSRFTKSIRCAFVYGSLASGDDVAVSDIDLMIIGSIGLVDLASAIKKAESKINRPINPTIYSEKEFKTKVQKKNSFLLNVLESEKIFVIGSQDELG